MFSDKLVDLVESGAVTGMNKSIDRGKIVSSFLAGSRKLYDFVNENPEILMLDVEYVNVCFPFTLMCDVERWIDSQLFFFCRIPQRLLSTDKFAPSTVALRLISLVKSALIRLGLSFQSHHHIITSSLHHIIPSSHHHKESKMDGADTKWDLICRPRIYSGVGGQVDFLRAAAISEGGKPIMVLNSCTSRFDHSPSLSSFSFLPSRSFSDPKDDRFYCSGESKIVPFLRLGAGVVTTRAHVHFVVTEYGVADLFGKNLRQRALELIKIAHPKHREALERAAIERLGPLH